MSAIIKTPTTETQKKDAEQSALYNKKFQQLQQNIDTETSRRIASDTALSSNISALTEALGNEVLNRTNAVTNEEKARIASDTALFNSLNAEIQNRKDAVTAEKNERIASDTALLNSLNAEIQNRKDAVTAEKNERIESDTTLFNSINAEIQNRIQALNDLQAALLLSIGNNQAAQDIKNENLRNQIQSATATQNASVQSLSERLEQEISARTKEDSTIANSISTEITERKNAINGLNGSLSAEIDSKANEILNELQNYINQKIESVASSLNYFTAPTATADGLAGIVPPAPAGTDIKFLTTKGWMTPDAAELTISIVPSQSGTLTYNKNSQSPKWANFDTSKLSISGTTSGTSAGSYTVYFTPTGLYVWADTKTQEARAVTWTIQKRKLAKPTAAVTEFTGDGTTHTLAISNYDANYITQSGTVSASDVGNYSASYTLKNSSNTTWADGTTSKVTINWSIANRALSQTQSTGFTQSGTLTYSGDTKTPTIQRYDSAVHDLSGDTSATNAGTYTLYIAPKSGLTWYDGTTTPVAVTWTIQKLKLAKPTAAETSFTYDGATKSLAISNFNATYMTQSGTISKTEAGEYSVEYTLKNSSNTTWTDGTTSKVVIEWYIQLNTLRKPEFAPGNNSYTYNGTAVTPAINYFDSNTMTKSDTLSATNAGNYTITIKLKNPSVNQWKDGTTADVVLTWSILPKYISRPKLAQSSYEFTGSNIIALLNNFDENSQWYTASGDLSAKTVGEHTITISLNNKNNIHWNDSGHTDDIILKWNITPKTLTQEQSNLVQDKVITWDGSLHNWYKAFSAYESGLYKWSYSGSAHGDYRSTSAGTHIVTNIAPADGCTWYDGTTAPKDFTWTITPIRIAKPTLSEFNFTYDGTAKTVTVTGIDSKYLSASYNALKVGGTLSATAAGTYTVTVSPSTLNGEPSAVIWDDDGTFNPVTLTWTINKATVAVPIADSTYFINDGTTHTLTLTNYDSSLMTQGGTVSASATGTYSATYTLKDTTNYIFTDGSTKVTVSWQIGGSEVPLPSVSIENAKIYSGGIDGFWRGTLQNFNTDIMEFSVSPAPSVKGKSSFSVDMDGTDPATWFNSNHTGKTITVTVKLKDKVNYQWQGGGTADKVLTTALEPAILPVNNFTQENTLKYSGNQYTWKSAVKMTIFKHFFAETFTNFTDAGTHTQNLTPKLWTVWQDGKYDTRKFTFTIDQADWSYTITDEDGKSYTVSTTDTAPVLQNDTYYRFYPKIRTGNFTISNTCGGTLSLSSPNSGHYVKVSDTEFKAGISTSGSFNIYVTITPPNSNYKAIQRFNLRVAGNTKLQDYSWQELAKMAYENKFADRFIVGDAKPITLKNRDASNIGFGGLDWSNNPTGYAVYIGESQCAYKETSCDEFDTCAVFAFVMFHSSNDYWVPLQPPANLSSVGNYDRASWEGHNRSNNFHLSLFTEDDVANYFVRPMTYINGTLYSPPLCLSCYEIFGENNHQVQTATVNNGQPFYENTENQDQYTYFYENNFPRVQKSKTDTTPVEFWIRPMALYSGGILDPTAQFLVRAAAKGKANWTVSNPASRDETHAVIPIFGICYNYNK